MSWVSHARSIDGPHGQKMIDLQLTGGLEFSLDLRSLSLVGCGFIFAKKSALRYAEDLMAIRPQGRRRTLSKKVSSFNVYMDQVYQIQAIRESTSATKDAPVIRVLLDEALSVRPASLSFSLVIRVRARLLIVAGR